jgi:ERCC4-type nuclease
MKQKIVKKPASLPPPTPKPHMIEDPPTSIRLFDGRGEGWEGWIEKFVQYGWQQKQLPAGDFYFLTRQKLTVGLEVKSVHDLVSRVGDARREFANLVDYVDIPIFLVWGAWNRTPDDSLIGHSKQRLTWAYIWNMLMTFQNEGLRIEVAFSREHAFTRINQLYAYYQKPEHQAGLVARRADNDRRIASLMAIPGVSKGLGTNLLKEFHSIRGLAMASPDQIAEVDKVGPKRSFTIYDFMTRDTPLR